MEWCAAPFLSATVLAHVPMENAQIRSNLKGLHAMMAIPQLLTTCAMALEHVLDKHPAADHLEVPATEAQASQLVLAMPLLGRQGMAGAPPMRLDSQTINIVNLTQ